MYIKVNNRGNNYHYDQNPNGYDKNGKVILSKAFPKKELNGLKNNDDIEEYKIKIINHTVNPVEPYFEENDGEIYNILSNFFNSKAFPTKESDESLEILYDFFNLLTRQIGRAMNKDDLSYNKMKAHKIRRAFNKGKVIIIKPKEKEIRKNTDKKYWCRNPLKEAAWIATHAYVIDNILSEEDIYRIIPKGNSKVALLWNMYIDAMDDVPESIKRFHYLDKDYESKFTKYYKNKELKSMYNGNDEEDDEDIIIDIHPVDDDEPGATPIESDSVPFEEAIETNIAEDVTSSKVINEISEIVNDDISNSKKEDKKDEKGEKIIDAKFEVIQNSNSEVSKKEINEISEKKENEKKENNINKKIERPEEPDQNIKINNDLSESRVPNLYRFTNLCRRIGYSVIYLNNNYYPKLIDALVFNRNNPNRDKRHIMIDPYIIYGDTIRVIYCDDKYNTFDEHGDFIIADKNGKDLLRESCFVAISQNQLIEKIIKGTFNKKNRKENCDQLPKVLSNYEDKYYFIDRIDLKNLREITYDKETNRSISFRDWKGLIVNISNIFKNPDIPICRFRISNFKDISHFKLICDNNVEMYYRSNLPNEESQIRAMRSGFWIDYNPDINPESQYIYGTMK